MNSIKFEVSLDLLEEMAECIYYCSWVSQDEIAAYMKSCVTDGNYEPEEWSLSGKGEVSSNRDVIEVENE